jgi:hypothetical protein
MADKFTVEDLEMACDDLATIPFFPREERASIMRQLAKMCPHREALRFIVDTTLARCKKWPSPSDLRGLLCSRYDAADGIDEPVCTIPGLTPEEQEAKYIERLGDYKSSGSIAPSSRALIAEAAAQIGGKK